MGHPPPARGGQTGCLFEPAGKMALVSEATVSRDLGQFFLTGQQLALSIVDLAFKQKVFGGQPKQLGKPAMKMERT